MDLTCLAAGRLLAASLEMGAGWEDGSGDGMGRWGLGCCPGAGLGMGLAFSTPSGTVTTISRVGDGPQPCPTRKVAL